MLAWLRVVEAGLVAEQWPTCVDALGSWPGPWTTVDAGAGVAVVSGFAIVLAALVSPGAVDGVLPGPMTWPVHGWTHEPASD